MDQDFLDRQYTEKEIFRLPEGSGDPGPAVVVGLVHHALVGRPRMQAFVCVTQS